MKNIHVLPTDKPSRLYTNARYKHYEFCELPRISTAYKKCHNIYITSDEEIKEGDWGYRDSGIVFKMTKELLEYYISIKDTDTHKRYKIILTTDQDLIKDGIQAIDDEFLEWFVKNPSCEEVEVNFVTKQLIKPYDVYNESVSYYKIIIPKEEPKQERMYSEEDIEKAFKVGFTLGYVGDTLIADKDKCFKRWFKIFKDK